MLFSTCCAVRPHAGGLRMEAHRPGAGILCSVPLLHDPRPDPAGGAVLGDFLEEVLLRYEEKREARRELVDPEARFERRVDVRDTVGDGEGELLRRRRAGLAHVITADADRVPLRHALRAVLEDVGDEPQRGLGREDVGPPRDVLLQDVVLHRAAELLGGDALLPSHGDVEGEQNRRRRVDGHRRGDLVQRDLIEQGLHVGQATDGDADLAHLAARHLGVGVVARLRGQVEGDAQARLPLFEQVAVAPVRLLGGGEAGVLAHRPQAAPVHRGLDAAGVGILSRVADVLVIAPVRLAVGAVQRLDGIARRAREFLTFPEALHRRVVRLLAPLGLSLTSRGHGGHLQRRAGRLPGLAERSALLLQRRPSVYPIASVGSNTIAAPALAERAAPS